MASIAANNDNDIVENSNNDNDVINNNNISSTDNDDTIIIEINDFMENCSNHEQDIKADEYNIEGSQEKATQNTPNHDIASSNIVNSDTPTANINRKLFVCGLNMKITESEIRNYFSTYGNIESVTLKPCRKAGKKNGYAFIVFETTEAVDITKTVSKHTINGVRIKVQTSKLRHSKILINLPSELAEEDLKAYFSEFGNIINIYMPCHKETNEREGFCVITYDSVEVVDEIDRTPIHTINGIEVSVQKSPFTDLNVENQPNSNRGKKSNKINRSGGNRKAKQDKQFRNQKNPMGQNFNGNSVINPNNERSNFLEPTFGGQPNLANTQNFSGRQNFYGRLNFRGSHNFDCRQGFESRANFGGQQNFYTEPTFSNQQNFDRRQQFYENRHNFGTEHSAVRPSSNTRQNHIEQHSFVGQNRNVRQNFGTEQTLSPFLQTNNNSKANNINAWSSNAQNLSSQSTSNLGYGNNQVGNGKNNYQQGYSGTFATTDGRNVGNTLGHTLENQNNANNAVSRILENTNRVENFGTKQALSPFLQTNNSKANNINVWSSIVQNLSSQSTSNLSYGNNQVCNGNNNYQQGYSSTFAITDGRNVGNTLGHTLENQNNTNRVENQSYYNNYRANTFFHNSSYANNNNRNTDNGRENKNEDFGFASGREDSQGNMRSMNGSFNANINSNDNRRYQPY